MRVRWKPTTADKEARKPGRAGDSGGSSDPLKAARTAVQSRLLGKCLLPCVTVRRHKIPRGWSGKGELFLKLKLSPGSLSLAPSLSPL